MDAINFSIPTEGQTQLLTADDLAALPPMKWIIKGVLPSSGIGAIFGPSGSGKSFLVLDMIAAITTNCAAWFGHRVTPCRVIYLCLEGGVGLRWRLEAYQRSRGANQFDLLRFQLSDFKLCSPDARAALMDAAGEDGAGMIVIDTLNRATLGYDENRPDDMGEIIQAASELQDMTGGIVLLVHHTGKNQSAGLRGHSSLHAALDVAIEVKKTDDGLHSWRLAKAKDAVDGLEHRFALDLTQIDVDPDGDPITSCVVRSTDDVPAPSKRRTPAQESSLKTLEDACISKGKDAVHVDEWREFYYRTCTAETSDAKRQAFRRARTDLVRIGAISITDDLYTIVDKTKAGALSLILSSNQHEYERASNG